MYLNILILLFISHLSFAAVERIENGSFVNISREILKLKNTHNTQKILVIFDIDETLLKHKECLSPEELTKSAFCNSKLFIKLCPSILTEPEVARLVKQIQAEKFNTLSLTARSQSLVPATFREFEKHQISFETEAFNKYTGDKRPVNKKEQLFQNGVFFADGVHKGKTLKYLISRYELDYDLIIFVDDNKANIGGLANQFKKSEQNLRLYHYTKYND